MRVMRFLALKRICLFRTRAFYRLETHEHDGEFQKNSDEGYAFFGVETHVPN